MILVQGIPKFMLDQTGKVTVFGKKNIITVSFLL